MSRSNSMRHRTSAALSSAPVLAWSGHTHVLMPFVRVHVRAAPAAAAAPPAAGRVAGLEALGAVVLAVEAVLPLGAEAAA